MTSNDIKVGDRVTWKPRYRHKNAPEIMTGKVISVHGGRKPWAGVHVTSPREGNWCVDLHLLTCVSDTELTKAIAAKPEWGMFGLTYTEDYEQRQREDLDAEAERFIQDVEMYAREYVALHGKGERHDASGEEYTDIILS